MSIPKTGKPVLDQPCIGKYYGHNGCCDQATQKVVTGTGLPTPTRISFCCNNQECLDTAVMFNNYPSRVTLTGKLYLK